MVQVIPQAGTGLSRIGASFGSGLGSALGEQIPKDIDRMTLSRGLKRLGEKSKTQEMSPFDLASELYGIRGGNSEIANALLPLLQNQMQIKQYQDQQKDSISTSGSKGLMQPSQSLGSQDIRREPGTDVPEKSQMRTILTPEDQQILQSSVQPPSREMIDQLASEKIRSQPSRFNVPGGVEKARAEAEADLNKSYQADLANLQAAQRKSGVADKFRQDFDNYLNDNIQKAGKDVFADIEGDMLNEFRNRAESEYASGKSEREAIKSAADDLLNFARNKQQLRNMGGYSIFQDTRKNINTLQEVRKEFEKYGRQREFKNILEDSLGLSPQMASYYTYPVVGKDTLKALESLKPIKTFDPTKSEAKKQKMTKDFVEKLSNSLGDNSILSIAAAASQKGYSPNDIISEITERYRDGKIKLNERQAQELALSVSSPAAQMFNMADYFYGSFIDNKVPMDQ